MPDRPIAYRIGFDADRHGATITLGDLRALVDACRHLPDGSPVLGLATTPAEPVAPHLPATDRAPVTDLVRIAVGALATRVRTDGTSAPVPTAIALDGIAFPGSDIASIALGVPPSPLGRVHVADIPSPATDDATPTPDPVLCGWPVLGTHAPPAFTRPCPCVASPGHGAFHACEHMMDRPGTRERIEAAPRPDSGNANPLDVARLGLFQHGPAHPRYRHRTDFLDADVALRDAIQADDENTRDGYRD